MITKPILPPKKGYVEIVNTDGEHVYQPTPRQAQIDELKNGLQNIDVTCIPEVGEDETANTTEIIMNKLDYLVNALNAVLELI